MSARLRPLALLPRAVLFAACALLLLLTQCAPPKATGAAVEAVDRSGEEGSAAREGGRVG